VLSSTQIYDWTHSRRWQSRRKKLPFGVYWRTLKTLRAKCDPVERVPPHGAWLWRLRNDEAIGSSPFPRRKQETGAAGPTPNPASTNHLAPQYTVSDAKVGNPTNALRISKTARKRGRRLWLAVAARSLRREDQVLVISSSVSRSSACLAGAALQFKGGALMSTIAAAAQTADRIDYWIRRHVIRYCYGSHPSQSQTKVQFRSR